MMKITESYNIFNECVNVLELIISLFLLTSKKKEWNEYIICFYGGFLFGIIPFYVIIENIPIALTGCIFLSLMLCVLQKKAKQKLYIPLEIVMFKTLLIIGITLFENNGCVALEIFSNTKHIALSLIHGILKCFGNYKIMNVEEGDIKNGTIFVNTDLPIVVYGEPLGHITQQMIDDYKKIQKSLE